MAPLKIFLCWAEDDSEQIARKIVNCLYNIFEPDIKIFFSEHNIAGGSRWNHELAEALELHNFGLLCLTPNNLNSGAIHYEAGALGKHHNDSHVIPLLFNINNIVALQGPISFFQAVDSNDEEKVVNNLFSEINKRLPEDRRRQKERLERAFSEDWQKVLECSREFISQAPQEEAIDPFREEVLTFIRDMRRETTNSKVLQDSIEQIITERLNEFSSKFGGEISSSVAKSLMGFEKKVSSSITEEISQLSDTTNKALSEWPKPHHGFDLTKPEDAAQAIDSLLSDREYHGQVMEDLWRVCRLVLREDTSQHPVDSLIDYIQFQEWSSKINKYLKRDMVEILKETPDRSHGWLISFRKALAQ